MLRSRFVASAFALVASASAQPALYDFDAALAYSDARNGQALMIAVDGQVVFERYSNGWLPTDPHRLASGVKSFAGVLLAIAVDDGLVRFEERLADVLVEWRGDARKSRITYRQLLSLTSGIEAGELGVVPTYADSIAQVTFAEPGQAFDYGPYPFQILGEALKRKLQPRETVGSYLQRKLIAPLGMRVGFWVGLVQGEPQLPSGVGLLPGEWLKFGEMVRRGGMAGGTRVVSEQNLGQCFVGSQASPGYGLGFWLLGDTGPVDTVAAMGQGKQRCYVIPSHKMTIVRFAEGEDLSWSEAAFLGALMPAGLATFGAGCTGTAGVPVLQAAPGSRPRLGSRFLLQATPVRAPAFGAFYFGASRSTWLGVPLPLDLTFLGAPQCRVQVALDVSAPAFSNTGTLSVDVPIPLDPVLTRGLLYAQCIVADAGANAAGLIATSGATLLLGR